ncbi:MAG: 1-acyl-sn-glycerol-3-phosphate acyltransferase [Anaerolineales bacterium]|nr:1-acyl-sn-glycerol-3-phosphate acyltransferase [Anaerolineales bacterium]NUQ86679.1 1-acyl-sn-glycerol-3-phosphate acyltransferase [Anaerolineales bacterium]
MNYPVYSYPRGLIARVAFDVLLLRRRSFREDARACIELLNPPLQVIGRENIPQCGPCVITVNHYYRAGFGAQWLALAISATVPVDVHWVITGELTYPGRWYAPVGMILSRLVLHRAARVYGFTTMPPMPPRPKDVEARAASVRKVLDYVRHAKEPLLGLAPEGGDSADGKLARPASGLGRFGLLLSSAGLRFVPVGAYEAEGVFTLHFGKAYELNIPRDLLSDDKDAQAIQIIMKNIAELLPPYLRGDFA